jgi:hypothetical protein
MRQPPKSAIKKEKPEWSLLEGEGVRGKTKKQRRQSEFYTF